MAPVSHWVLTRRLAFASCVPLLALAACSSSPSPQGAATTTTAPTGNSASTNRPPTSTTSGVVPNYSASLNARPYVQQTSCTMVGGSWVDKGTVRNSTKSPLRFTIVVDFVTAHGNTVMNTQVVHVPTVAPGSTASWSAADPQGQTSLACIVRFSQFNG